MRIIAGEHRHRAILPPPDASTTRPITDRVKENLFNRLMSLGLLGEGYVLDIFSGTGTLGLEALSRGAEHCVFVERDRRARGLLEQNLAALRLADRAGVLAVDALTSNLPALVPHRPLTLIFCDPPYALTADPATMPLVGQILSRLASVADAGACAVLRVQSDVAAPIIDGWHRPRSHRYGSMTLHLYLRPGEVSENDNSD